MRPIRLAALSLIAGCAPAAITVAAPDRPALAFPMACEVGRTCEIQHYVDRRAGTGVEDYRCGRQTYEAHTGLDIRVPDMAAQGAGVAVLAAASGSVSRLRDGVADISIRAAGAPPVAGQECGNGVAVDHGGGLETQYCHVARGSIRVKVGDPVVAGTPLARVGLSGNTEFPHLHFNVRQDGKVVDPFAPDAAAKACGPQGSLWSARALQQMPYKRGAVLNAGFASGQLDMAAIERGGIPGPTQSAPYVVAYARAIGLEAGDRLELELFGPDGARLAKDQRDPLESDKAQWFMLVGRKRPPTGWTAGAYTAQFKVWRDGKVAVSRRFETRL